MSTETKRRRWFGRKQLSGTVSGLEVVNFTPMIVETIRANKFSAYDQMYRSQSSVRTVVDFLSKNVAQLKPKVYRRVSTQNREELSAHPLQRALLRPNDVTTGYRLFRDTVADKCLYDEAYWLKLRNGPAFQLVRLPPIWVAVASTNALTASEYEISIPGTAPFTVPAVDVVHFQGYSPLDPRLGLSPLESLRQLLLDEYEISKGRRAMWRNASRINGAIERPLDAPDWSEAARKRFREDWQATYGGSDNDGMMAVIEEGMHLNSYTFDPKEAEYIASRKLTMEEVARAYHVPLPSVGLLDNSNYSQSVEAHRNLYQDTLGPILEELEQEIVLQLAKEFADVDGVYVEFNLADKLKGSFEEQAQVLSTAVGGPWISRNEVRAMQNLPPIPGGNEIIIPLNVVLGGGQQASPQTPTEVPQPGKARKSLLPGLGTMRDRYASRAEEEIRSFFDMQHQSVKSLAGRGRKAFDTGRWNATLADLLFRLSQSTSTAFGHRAAQALNAAFDESYTLHFWQENAKRAAENINAQTDDMLGAEGADPNSVFDNLTDAEAPRLAMTRATMAAAFGGEEAAKQAGAPAEKVWTVTSGNPRPSHAEMDGQSTPVGEVFSNGMQWPGDPNGGVDEVSNCSCILGIEYVS